MKQSWKAIWWAPSCLLFGLGFMSACSKSQQPTFVSTDVTGSALSAPFQLTDLSGQKRTLESYRGQVVALFFGYTHCPDVCPTTLAQWAQIRHQLGDKADRLQVLFVSVDPQRDTPELLKAYVPRFDSSFNALTGSEAQLKPLLDGLRVYAAKAQGATDEAYLMDHTASSYVFDAKGNLRLLVRYNTPAADVVKDIQQLM